MATYRPKNDILIPEPCSQKWEAMDGDAQKRHCAACSCDVHNLAALTPRQIEALMANPDHLPCVRVARYDDGTLLVAEEPRSRPSYGFVASAAIVALVTLSSGVGCAQDQGRTMGKIMPVATYSGQVLDADGKPAAHATVSLTRQVEGKEERQETETDASGHFRLATRFGEWQAEVIGARGSYSMSDRQTVKLAPGEQKTAGEIRMRRITVTAGVPMMVPPPEKPKAVKK